MNEINLSIIISNETSKTLLPEAIRDYNLIAIIFGVPYVWKSIWTIRVLSIEFRSLHPNSVTHAHFNGDSLLKICWMLFIENRKYSSSSKWGIISSDSKPFQLNSHEIQKPQYANELFYNVCSHCQNERLSKTLTTMRFNQFVNKN